MKNLKFYSLAISALFILTLGTQAQGVYKLQSENSKLLVAGTSSVHDWEVKATKFSAETSLEVDQNTVSQVSDVLFTASAESLESGKGLMDRKMQEALKANKHPEIKFSLKEDETINGNKATISGMLTIAGQTREVDVSVHFNELNPQKFGVTGEVPIKMSDFNIDQPTAMMGTIKTGDEVTVKFDLEFILTNEDLTRSN